jgi:CubicO group peptidase (beta-lactamase class C family)
LASPFVALFLLAATSSEASPQPLPTKPSSTIPASALTAEPTAPAHDLAPADLQAWLDGLMPYGLARGDIAGAVVVVVRNGKVVLAKGYGLAGVAHRRPVDPARTLFRQGSISKLVTWTAVMQLQERGAVDLDADVNRYLDFRIPPAFGKPITLRDLMTHTAGFEETLRDISGPMSLRTYVKTHVPRRIFGPGTMPAYSNYGAALAGYIVQRVSGEQFAQYAQDHVLGPLGMDRSTFDEPLPPSLRPDMSAGYLTAHAPPRPFEIALAPAGAFTSTGQDMGRLMLAYLSGAAPGLAKTTLPAMERANYSPAPGVPGMALGFYHSDRNGHLIVGHGGDTEYFHTDLFLFPDDGVGLYMAFNSAGRSDAADQLRTEVFDGFMQRYFPPLGPAPPIPVRQAASDSAKVAGLYSSSRRSDSSFVSIGDLFGQRRVSPRAAGKLTVGGIDDLADRPLLFSEIAPLLWQAPTGERLGARRRTDGRFDLFPAPAVVGFEPTPWYRARTWLAPALIASLGVLVVTVIAWPWLAVVRCRYDAKTPLAGAKLVLHRATRILAIAALAAALSWAAMLNAMMNDLALLAGARIDPWLRLNQALAWLTLVGLVVAVANAAVQPARRWRGWGAAWDAITALGFAALAYASVLFHLAGPSLRF